MRGDGGRVWAGYETPAAGLSGVRPATIAVGVSAAFVGASLLVVTPNVHNRLDPVVVWPWALLGVASVAAVWHVRRRVRRGQEARPGPWAMALLVVGWALGGPGVAGKALSPDLHHSLRVSCATNMRQVGSAILAYANDHQDRYPDRLERLRSGANVTAEVFVCPESAKDAVRGPTKLAVAAGMIADGHVPYTYLGAGLRSDCDPDTVVLYEPVSNHGGAGMNVLLGDGRVEFAGAAEAREIVDRIAAGEWPVVWNGKRPTSEPPVGRP